MPRDPSRPGSQPAWKAGASGPARGGPRYAWKPGDAPPRRRSRRVKQLLLGLGGVVCTILIVVLIKLLQPPPHATLVLVAADPAAAVDRLDVPLDLYGWAGGRQLADWARDAGQKEPLNKVGQVTPQPLGDPAPFGALDEWARRLEASGGDPLVIYVGLYGAADPEHGPFLFTGGGRLPLDKLLGALGRGGLRSKQKILLLDRPSGSSPTSASAACWRWSRRSRPSRSWW
jgi:hypothetical protein